MLEIKKVIRENAANVGIRVSNADGLTIADIQKASEVALTIAEIEGGWDCLELGWYDLPKDSHKLVDFEDGLTTDATAFFSLNRRSIAVIVGK